MMTLEGLRAEPFVQPLGEDAKLLDYAKAVMALHKFKTLSDTKEILYYQDGIWVDGGDIIIKQECEKIIPECSNYKVNEVMGIIQRKTFCKRDKFNNDLTKLVLSNGILDLKTFKLSSFNPDFLSTIKISLPYDPDARCPKFIQFLKDVLPNKNDIITVIEEFSNILTTNQKNFEVSAIWTGTGGNGKSALLKIIRGVFGSENSSSVSIHSMQGERFAVSQLYSKLVNIHADISNKELNNLGMFKQLVSGEPVSAEKKNKDAFQLYNFAKMFYSANEMPDIKDNSDGAFRRIYVTKFENVFLPGVNRIDDIDKIILEDERSGIFNLILENYKTLLRNDGFRYKQSIANVRETIKKESDKLLEFIEEYFVEDPNGFISKDDCYEKYHKYSKDKNYEINSKQKLGANLPTYGFKNHSRSIRGKTCRGWCGFSLKEDKSNVKGLDEQLTLEVEN